MVERHLWTKNPDEIQNFVFGDVVERHLWTKNPHKFFFQKNKKSSFGNIMERHLWTKKPH